MELLSRNRSIRTEKHVAESGKLLHRIFEKQVVDRSDHPAVECAVTGVCLTYKELNDRANNLAVQLVSMGISPNDIVAVYLPRGLDQYLAMLAILKAGGAFLPIDSEFPEDRVSYILRDSDAKVVLTCHSLNSAVVIGGRAVLTMESLDTICGADALLFEPVVPRPSDLCYVIYTSGTTGFPKGVAISHINAVTFVRAIEESYGIVPDDRILQGFSTTFDASAEEIWMAFSSGATLVAVDAATMKAVDELGTRLRELDITVFSTVPTLLRVISAENLPRLRLLISGAEAARKDIVEKWARPGRRVMNSYGPTEATVAATFDWCEAGAPITIGYPMPGYQVMVVDEDLEDVADGVEGELCIGGDAVSLHGYINRPDLNLKKFFYRDGTRYYRTGDVVLRDHQGKLVCRGRIDSQVKIRGYRIELEEIEERIGRWGGCDGAVVTVIEEENRGPRLAAYLVHPDSNKPDLRALVAFLREGLPSYMIPAHFVSLDPGDVPRLGGGKILRNNLPPLSACKPLSLGRDAGDTDGEDDRDLSATARKILDVLRRVAGEQMGAGESFFDYGGDSVMAVQVISFCREDDDLSQLSIRDLYKNPTALSLSACLQTRSDAAAVAQIAGAARAEGNETRHKRVSQRQYLACGAAQVLVILGLSAFAAYAAFAMIWGWAALGTHLAFGVKQWIIFTALMIVVVLPALGMLTVLPVGLLIKRLVIGRFEEGEYPVWSWGYFRWWLGNLLLAPIRGVAGRFVGTPLAPLLFRILGARVGKGVYLDAVFGDCDLVEIEDGATLSWGAVLRTHSLSGGVLRLRRVHLGKNVMVGSMGIVGGGVRMGDNSKLHAFSHLVAGTITPEGSEWSGSPAVRVEDRDNGISRVISRHEAESKPSDIWSTWQEGLRILFWQSVYRRVHGLLALVPWALSVGLLVYLEHAYRAVSSLNLAFLIPFALLFSAIRFLGSLGVTIAAKWLLTGRAQAGTISLNSREYVRRWYCASLMRGLVAPEGTRGTTETLLMPLVCRLLGMQVGRNTEISDAYIPNPDLTSLGSYSMLADHCIIGAPLVHRGRMTIGPVSIGERTFIGNGAYVSFTTARVEDNCLVGVLTRAPEKTHPSSSWLGSPAIWLPNRVETCLPDEVTYNPPKALYWARSFFNIWKMFLPGALIEVIFWTVLKLYVVAYAALPLLVYAAVFPLMMWIGAAMVLLTPIVCKWLMIWRYREGNQPLWSVWMWRNEIVYEIELLLMAGFTPVLQGTPLLGWYFRGMGARVGKRTCIQGYALMDPDLVTFGDDVTMEGFPQTHLFEDRVMKLGPVTVEDGCSVGYSSCVLYNSRMRAGATLDEFSLIMKNETFLPDRTYSGLPADEVRRHAAPQEIPARSQSASPRVSVKIRNYSAGGQNGRKSQPVTAWAASVSGHGRVQQKGEAFPKPSSARAPLKPMAGRSR